MYQIKPKVKNPDYRSIKEQKKREQNEKARAEKEKEAVEAKSRQEQAAKQEQLHNNVVAVVESNTEGVKGVLEGLKEQIAQFDIDIPEFDGSPIVKAIEDSTKNLNKSLSGLNKKVGDIKIEVPKIDLDSHTEKMVKQMQKNTKDLTKVLETLKDQIMQIKLETNEPITDWKFEVNRDSNRDIESIDAKANITLN